MLDKLLRIQESRTLLLAVGWFLFITFLFFLPGSALPSDDWMSKIAFDKWVHVGFFSILTYLWSKVFQPKGIKALYLFLSALAYGYLVEICQHEWVVHRSFDWGDLIADAAGSIIGIVWWLYKKNRPL